jgi:nitroreductase/NAD-dependent dihydropyrimidine dehydrogenase PreA subunit
MSLFVINEDQCTCCGICAEACPAKIIELGEQKSFPLPVADTDIRCIDCGHCVAICPHGALNHRSMAHEECPSVRKKWLLDPEQAKHFLRTRRSIRNYQQRSVERETLTKLIEIAAYAPTGHNSQTVNWRIILDTEQVGKLTGLVIDWMRNMQQESPQLAKSMNLDSVISAWENGTDRVCRSAPHIILAHAHQKDRFAPISCPIALTYLELSAPSFGLGTCWGGYFNAAARAWGPLQEALGLPAGHQTFGVLLVGYPKYSYYRLPLRKKPQLSWS